MTVTILIDLETRQPARGEVMRLSKLLRSLASHCPGYEGGITWCDLGEGKMFLIAHHWQSMEQWHDFESDPRAAGLLVQLEGIAAKPAVIRGYTSDVDVS